MKGAKELYEFMKGLSRQDASLFPAIVKTINGDDTIDVDVDGLTFYGVQLKASVIEGQKGIRVKPAKDSVVLIERIGDERSNDYAVCMCSEVDEVLCEIKTAKLLMDSNGFELNKGNDKLKDVIKLIIEAIQVVVVLQGKSPDYLKLTQAMQKLNNIMK